MTLCDEMAKATATLPLALGGMGLRSAERARVAAHWASWADTLPKIQERHPAVAELIVGSLTGAPESPCLGAVHAAVQELDGVGFVVPEWTALADGLRPEPREPEHHEPGAQRAGWQHEAASCVERHYRATCILPHLSPTRRAMLRSQSGPVAGIPFSTTPSSCLTRLEPALFRVLLQRRLSLPLLLTKRFCRCGRLLDAFGHHRAACSRSGVLGRRGFSLESAAARVCRVDLGVPNAHDNRRLEVVADGLPLFGGVQLAVDTTLVSAIQGDGQPQRGAADRDGVALKRARRRKETTYPELVQPGSRARLVVLALEVGGRWSQEARTFVQLLAEARTRSEPLLMRRRMEQAWRLRWFSILSADMGWTVTRPLTMRLSGISTTQGYAGELSPVARDRL